MLLEVDGIDAYYGPVQALRELSLGVDEGEIVAMLGANGAGKTTTLRVISGMLHPRGGEVRLNGTAISRLRPEEIVRLGVAHVPEGRELFSELTVYENLRMGYWTHRSDRRGFQQRLDEA